MLVLVDEFYLSALDDRHESLLDEHEDGQIEEDESETEQDQMESESGEMAEADSVALEPEADPYKRLMNKLNYLLSTGTEDNIIYAFELARSAVNTGRFNYDTTLSEGINELYTKIRHIITEDPSLRALMNSSMTDREHSFDQIQENKVQLRLVANFGNVAEQPASKGHEFNHDNNPFAYKLPGAA